MLVFESDRYIGQPNTTTYVQNLCKAQTTSKYIDNTWRKIYGEVFNFLTCSKEFVEPFLWPLRNGKHITSEIQNHQNLQSILEWKEVFTQKTYQQYSLSKLVLLQSQKDIIGVKENIYKIKLMSIPIYTKKHQCPNFLLT